MARPPECSGAQWLALTAPYRAAWARSRRRCALCRKPIDYTLRFPNRWSLTVDHIIPVWADGPALDPANWQPAHLTCNSKRGATEGNAQRARGRARRTALTW